MNLSRYWTNFIGWQVGSSSGQSPKGFITQWGHELSEPDIESGEFTIHSLAEPETAYEITINIAGSSPYMLGLYLALVMVGFKPDDGLEETLFSLRDMLEFYSRKPEVPPVKLQPKAIDATIVNRRKRPALVLTG